MSKKIKIYIVSILLPLAVGGLAALLTKDSYSVYKTLERPFFAPPAIIFPIVWAILYILMGISFAKVYQTPSPSRFSAVKIYLISLVLNFFWPIIFFRLELFWVAFVWILLLLVSVAVMTSKFSAVNKSAGLLQIPYLIWCAFACILNLSVAIMN